MLHPFREGNGRTQREFIRQLAYNAGYELDLNKPHLKERLLQATIISVTNSNAELETIIRENLHPLPEIIKEKYLTKLKQNQPPSKETDQLIAKDLLKNYSEKLVAQAIATYSPKAPDISSKAIVYASNIIKTIKTPKKTVSKEKGIFR